MENCNLHTIIRLPEGVFSPYTKIKTNLLFFTKGKPTDTIWFYEHRYPAGVKSYSKTKPLRLEEFAPIEAWWGKESDGFASRTESAQAWKVDFKASKQEAEAKAKPHWDRAETLGNEASELVKQIKSLRDTLKRKPKESVRKKTESKIADLNEKVEAARQQAREQQSIGDRHFWPIYNLDIKNPNAPEKEVHDTDKLLAKYKELLGKIETTQTILRNELSSALVHLFESVAIK